MTKAIGEDILVKEPMISEAMLTGLAWNNPDIYNFYTKEKLNSKHFGNKHYGFFFELGRYMNGKKLSVFDDITVAQSVMELGFQSHYTKYGEFETISELMEEARDKYDNLEGYVSDVKKYHLIRDLRYLYGDKVIEKTDKYNYKNLSAGQIILYWRDKIDKIALNLDSEVKSEDMLDGLKELVEETDTNPDIGISYYKSDILNDITNGWKRGTVTLTSAFSGNGKSSFSVYAHIMGCIESNTPMAIIANETGNKFYQRLLLITIIGNELYGKIDDKGFNRKNISRGNFTDAEKKKLYAAIKWIDDIVKNKQLIKFIPMEDYTMDNVEKIIRYWSNRGYYYWLVDTLKPSADSGDARWSKFVQDSERLYQLAKPDGLNLAMHWNAQSADEALKMRYLTELCLADGRKIKNVVDFCSHFRPLKEDEYEGGKKPLQIYRYIPNPMTGEGTVKKNIGEPRKGTICYALFVSKSRFGESNINGLDPIIYRVDLNSNRWIELGYAFIERDTY